MHGTRNNLGQGSAVELHRPHAVADLEGQLPPQM